ncbi:MAG: alkaline phosphatase PafA [Balneolaceae bacterium]|nr:alkaline phosphatase PafA [Balneolaceae bacterium]
MNSYFKKIIFTALSFLITLPLFAQNTPASSDLDDRPKLVVGIVVDQMRYEYLTQYWDQFEEGGFKRMVNEGYNFTNTHFNYFPTFTGPGHAAIFTGATPSVNGIVGNSWYNRSLGRSEYVVEDTSVMTVGGEGDVGKMSPKNLLSTTFTDELKTASKHSKIVAISIKDRGAVLPAGHVGDMAFWYDSDTGNFVSSSWYMDELPKWVSEFNKEGVAREYSNKTWDLLLDKKEYAVSNTDDTPYEGTFPWEEKPVFPHELGKEEEGSYRAIRNSPFGNTIAKDLAIKAVKAENLGSDNATDVLAIGFSSPDYIGHQFGPHSMELQDTYIRLDRDLADLFSTLDDQVGQGNYMVFLTSDHGVVDVPNELIDRGLPGGYFDSETAIDSLKSFLNEAYGEGDWVEAYTNQQVYMNRILIASEGSWLEDVQYDAAEFLLNFEGVLSTNTASNFKMKDYSSGLQAMYQRGFMNDRSGDVYIQLKPGWLDSSYRTGTSHGSPFSYDTHVPMLFFGKGIPQGTNNRKMDITQLAPTISTLLNISFPSGTEAIPMDFEQ